jgi:hypothetical protein
MNMKCTRGQYRQIGSISRDLTVRSQQRYNETPAHGFGTIVELSGHKYEGDFVAGKKYD